jgi:hypothetical protein
MRACLIVAAAATTAIAAAATTTAAPSSATTAATTTASAKSAATAAATSAASAGAAAIARRTRFVHNDATPFELLAVQRLNGALSFFIILNFDKAEAARLARETVADEHNAGWSYAGLREPFSDFFFSSLKRKIPDVKFLH